MVHGFSHFRILRDHINLLSLKSENGPPNCLDMCSYVRGSLTQFIFHHTFAVKPSVLYYINFVFLVQRMLNLDKRYISQLIFFYNI